MSVELYNVIIEKLQELERLDYEKTIWLVTVEHIETRKQVQHNLIRNVPMKRELHAQMPALPRRIEQVEMIELLQHDLGQEQKV